MPVAWYVPCRWMSSKRWLPWVSKAWDGWKEGENQWIERTIPGILWKGEVCWDHQKSFIKFYNPHLQCLRGCERKVIRGLLHLVVNMRNMIIYTHSDIVTLYNSLVNTSKPSLLMIPAPVAPPHGLFVGLVFHICVLLVWIKANECCIQWDTQSEVSL